MNKGILYLPSWFPSRVDPYPGDFIKRHAEAASLYNRITVFYTVLDDTITEAEIVEESVNENLKVLIYYYPSVKKTLSSVINGVKRFFALRKMYNNVFAHSSPDLVHVHVAYPAGLFALYLKKRKELKYLITEHNTIYMPQSGGYFKAGEFERRMTPLIYRSAKRVHAVSKSLAEALVNFKLASSLPVVIPNVVDIDIFKYIEKAKNNFFQFVHVSSLSDQKNPEGMLKAFAIVKKKRNDFILKIIGSTGEKFKTLIKELSLKDEVVFMGEIEYNEVANEIKNADAMIHFTRYETFGCVIAESLCAGVPVIVSDLEVTRELITDKADGLLVKESDVHDLAEKILFFMQGGLQIKARQVAEKNQQKFNYSRIGKMFDELYDSVMQKKKA